MSLCWNAVLREHEGSIAAQRPCARASGTIKHCGQGWKKHMRPKKRHSDNIVFSAIIITHILAFVACRVDWFIALRRTQDSWKCISQCLCVHGCPVTQKARLTESRLLHMHTDSYHVCFDFQFILWCKKILAQCSPVKEKTKVCLNVTVLSFYILLLNPSDFIKSFSTKTTKVLY